MKTFKEFLDESYAHLSEASATKSKPTELQVRMAAAADNNKRIRLRKSHMHSALLNAVKAGPKGRSLDVERMADKLAKSQSPSRYQQRRAENIKISTGELTQAQQKKIKRKQERAAALGMDIHHNQGVKSSGDKMRNMSPEEKSEYRENEAKNHRYHGDDPKNLVVANSTETSEFSPHTPGFHHNKYHSFERINAKELQDLPISPQRAFTTLVNQARRRKKRAPELRARMAAGAERNNIKD